MDNILYEALGRYYHALELSGYQSFEKSQKLLLLIFYHDFMMHDYRGLLSKDDYHLIERALDCIWGSTCLISYPDYLKMGKLHLGQMTELANRVKTLEDTEIIKPYTGDVSTDDSDIIIVEGGDDE